MRPKELFTENIKTWDVERPEVVSMRFWSSWVLHRQENDLLEASSPANRLEKSEEFNLERYGCELEAKLDLLKNAIQQRGARHQVHTWLGAQGLLCLVVLM